MQFRKASSLITQSIFPCYTNSYNIIPGTCGWKKLGSEIKINNFHSCSLTEGILLSFQGNNENILTFQNLFPTLFFFFSLSIQILFWFQSSTKCIKGCGDSCKTSTPSKKLNALNANGNMILMFSTMFAKNIFHNEIDVLCLVCKKYDCYQPLLKCRSITNEVP